jgi:flavin reductase
MSRQDVTECPEARCRPVRPRRTVAASPFSPPGEVIYVADAAVPLDQNSFRVAMSLLPTGVAIVTCGSGDSTQAVTASSLTSVSLDPLLLLISIRSDGKIRSSIESSGRFAVSILHEDQRELSTFFATGDRSIGSEAMRQLGGPVGETTGSALVDDALAVLECEVQAQHTEGDHELFVGRVLAIRHGDVERAPLVYHRGSYAGLR